MQALLHVVQGFAVAHVSLLLFFLIGSVAFPWCDSERFDDASRVMLRVACTCGLGLAIVGLGMFVLGSVGWFNVPATLALPVVLFAAGCAAWRISPATAAFWRSRWLALTRCWSWPILLVYAALLLIGVRATIPDANVYSDAIYYHLAQSQWWANAGSLKPDPYLQYPFYANNFLMLYVAWMICGVGEFSTYLTWLTGLLAALAVYAAIDDYLPSVKRWIRLTLGLLGVISLIATAIFLDYAVLGYIDVQIGAIALLAVAAIQIALRDCRPGWLFVAAVLAGFLAGMKASFFLLVPIYIVAIVWAAIALGRPRNRIAMMVALLCVVAIPWYARNLVLTGDPIDPVINLALYNHDGVWEKQEWDGIVSDFSTPHTLRSFVTLPVRAYLDPTSDDFREYGASGVMLFLYLPTLVGLLALLMRKRLAPQLAIPIAVLTWFVVYYFVTSSLLRYALLLYPLLAVCVAMLLLELVSRKPRLTPLAIAIAVVAALPNLINEPVNYQFTHNDVISDLKHLPSYHGDQAFLMENDDGYPAAQAAMDWMRAHGYAGNVFVVSGTAFDYWMLRQGISSIGTSNGPAGYQRLARAIDAGEAAEFLDDLGTHAVVVGPQVFLDANYGELLARQLRAAGYRQIPVSHPEGYRVFVKDGNRRYTLTSSS
jgi:hypothetical protein